MIIRLYRRLLRILPAAFRDEYGDEMCRVVEEHWYAIRARIGIVGRLRFWQRQILAVLKEAIGQRMRRDREHGVASFAYGARDGRSRSMEGIWLDAHHSVRSLLKHPAFTCITGRSVVPREIVGVVSAVRPLGHESEPRPEIYLPLTQVGSGSLTFVLETAPGLPAPTAQVREAIWTANPAQAIRAATTLESLLAEWLEERRFNLVLLSSFAMIAMVLATVGIYALISFSVEPRVVELGIRRALGGRTSHLLGMVLREGVTLAGTGIVLGLIAAFGLTRFIQGMLFGVEPADPATFVALAVGVLVVAALAALIPALRATRVDPMVALRND
jgi:hypothetical protein